MWLQDVCVVAASVSPSRTSTLKYVHILTERTEGNVNEMSRLVLHTSHGTASTAEVASPRKLQLIFGKWNRYLLNRDDSEFIWPNSFLLLKQEGKFVREITDSRSTAYC